MCAVITTENIQHIVYNNTRFTITAKIFVENSERFKRSQ